MQMEFLWVFGLGFLGCLGFSFGGGFFVCFLVFVACWVVEYQS